MKYVRHALELSYIFSGSLSPVRRKPLELLNRLCLDRSPSFCSRISIVCVGSALFYQLSLTVPEYVPYVFQVLAQMLESHEPSNLPAEYSSLLPFLLTPTVWQQKGSIPGLVRLLRAFLARDGDRMMAAGQVANVLAVVQQRLIPSKMNDVWGFELLQAVVLYVKPYIISPSCYYVVLN
jgi:hypothetical protein